MAQVQKSGIMASAKDALAKGGAVVNYQHYPYWWAYAMGGAKLGTGIAAAIADCISSGFFFLAIFDFIAPGLTTDNKSTAVWILVISMFFSLCFYLAAESAMFMGSGHYETVAASRASDTHGDMKRKATQGNVNEFFTRYRVWISTIAMTYMVTTDFLGFYKIEWEYIWRPDGVLSPALRLVLAVPINLVIAGFLFFWALNGVLWGAQQIEYGQDEKFARRRLLLVADARSGLRPGMSTQNPTRQLTPPGAAKQLPPGVSKSAPPTSSVQTVKMPQTSSVNEW